MIPTIDNMNEVMDNCKSSSVVKAFFAAIENEKISCCVWKGSYDLKDIICSNGDIDLLVSRKDVDKIINVLNCSGFKRAIASKSRLHLGVDEYYAYDEELNKYVHIQLYHKLIFGERLIENIHLPIEKDVLNSAVVLEGIPFISPDFELLIYVIRKYIQKNNIYLLRPGAKKKIEHDIREEFDYLLERVDITDVVPAKITNIICRNIFNQCIENMSAQISIPRWMYLRKQILKSLAPFRRKAPLFAFLSWLYRRYHVLYDNNLSHYTSHKIPSNGGLSIAVIGSDGSGKSTAINYLSKWLGQVYKVRYFHMGRPKPSLLTSVVSRLARGLHPIVCKNYTDGEAGVLISTEWPSIFHWVPKLLVLSIARDRYKLYSKIQRSCNNGVVALIDRYPVKEIKQMDCARMHLLPGYNKENPGIMASLEKKYYEKILSPDVTMLLVVDPEVAAARQPDDGYAYVIRRATEIQEISKELCNKVVTIDSSLSLENVQRQLRQTIWQQI